MIYLLYMVGIIAFVLVGCIILLKSNEWLHETQKKWKQKEQEILTTNHQLDDIQIQLDSINPVLEKSNEIIKKVIKD
ncbi:hypothetical protein [Tannockella kyphosi]|uniref:hypothetical protein n=1 Tax=Tannockella kyphosi TaxID=2899121 RepID=UPI0020122E64|nr:hypothetical protein [Tannockella kyphosi]